MADMIVRVIGRMVLTKSQSCWKLPNFEQLQ